MRTWWNLEIHESAHTQVCRCYMSGLGLLFDWLPGFKRGGTKKLIMKTELPKLFHYT